ncbi:MAG: hypothetical protein O2779_03285 [Nanoarchaeota archaeon]|nr:hypothetical protein [Nanoarchaeota archaeon]
MNDDERDELSKLTPRERIKRLKELQEQRKQDIAEAEKLIESSEDQAEGDELADRIAVPEPRIVDISSLFSPEDEVIATKEDVTADNVEYFVQEAYAAALGARESGQELNAEAVKDLGSKLQSVKYMHPSDEIAKRAVAALGIFYEIRKEQDDS